MASVPPDSPYVSYRDVTQTADPARQSAAIAHLKAAVVHFETETPERSRSGVFVAAEAIGYLIPLLDPVQDAGDIAELRQRRTKIERMPRPVTPIAVPLLDDLELRDIVDEHAAVKFDVDGTGPGRWTWITPDAAWLVYDQIGGGEIRSALQLFGSVTFWMFWDNGYDAMRALDDDYDGRLTGAELRHLGLWRDRNSSGVSERGEVLPLASYDVIALFYETSGCRTRAARRPPRAASSTATARRARRGMWPCSRPGEPPVFSACSVGPLPLLDRQAGEQSARLGTVSSSSPAGVREPIPTSRSCHFSSNEFRAARDVAAARV